MTLAVVLAPEAVTDFEQHCAWYAGVAPELEIRFIDAFFIVAERLAEFPRSAPALASLPRYRRALLRELPISIVYEVRGGEVRIVAVPHHRQDSIAWRVR